jgi:general stress protein 26
MLVSPPIQEFEDLFMTSDRGREAIPEIAALINKIDICHLATRGDDGELHARPMSNNGEVEWDGRSWFFAPADGRLVAELRADPAAVAAYRAGEAYDFISVSGRAVVETDPELKKQYWQAELERWFPNGPDDPNVALIRLDAENAEWWTGDGDGRADLRESVATT